jgi:hypothetical protein
LPLISAIPAAVGLARWTASNPAGFMRSASLRLLTRATLRFDQALPGRRGVNLRRKVRS